MPEPKTGSVSGFLAGTLIVVGVQVGVFMGIHAQDRPVPLPPAPNTPTLTDTCSQHKYRVWTTGTGGIAVYPDPTCGEAQP